MVKEHGYDRGALTAGSQEITFVEGAVGQAENGAWGELFQLHQGVAGSSCRAWLPG